MLLNCFDDLRRSCRRKEGEPIYLLSSLGQLKINLSVGQDAPSITARLELFLLGRLISYTYDFSLPSLSGGKVSLRSFRGKAVLLNFWATWCGPCRSEMPILEKLYRELAANGFTVLAVSDEEKDAVQKFVRTFGYTFPVLLDPDRRVFDHFRVMAIPATKCSAVRAD